MDFYLRNRLPGKVLGVNVVQELLKFLNLIFSLVWNLYSGRVEEFFGSKYRCSSSQSESQRITWSC